MPYKEERCTSIPVVGTESVSKRNKLDNDKPNLGNLDFFKKINRIRPFEA